MTGQIITETKMTATPAPYQVRHISPNLCEPTGLTNRRKAHCRDCKAELRPGEGHRWRELFAFGTPLFYVCDADHEERTKMLLPPVDDECPDHDKDTIVEAIYPNCYDGSNCDSKIEVEFCAYCRKVLK